VKKDTILVVSKEKLIHLKLCLKKGFAVHRRLTMCVERRQSILETT